MEKTALDTIATCTVTMSSKAGFSRGNQLGKCCQDLSHCDSLQGSTKLRVATIFHRLSKMLAMKASVFVLITRTGHHESLDSLL